MSVSAVSASFDGFDSLGRHGSRDVTGPTKKVTEKRQKVTKSVGKEHVDLTVLDGFGSSLPDYGLFLTKVLKPVRTVQNGDGQKDGFSGYFCSQKTHRRRATILNP